MTQSREIDLSKIDIADQARKHFDENDLLSLGENIKEHGLLVPLLVVANGDRFTLVAGERRLRAMRLVGIKKAQVIVMNAMDAGDTAVVQFIENDCRSALKPVEKARAMLEIKQKKGWMNKDLAEHLHMDASLVTRYLSLFDTIPAVQEAAAADDKIGPNAWYSISLLPPDQQLGMLERRLSGTPASQIANLSRRQRNGNNGASAVKIPKVKLPLASGVTVQVSGADLDLPAVVEVLQDLLKQARKGIDDGIDVRAFVAVLTAKVKDKAKKA